MYSPIDGGWWVVEILRERRRERMQKDKGKDKVPKPTPEGDEVISNNQLLAAMRERLAKRRGGSKEKQPKELKIEPQ